MGFHVPEQVIRVSVVSVLGAKRDGILALASTVRLLLTLKTTVRPSARTTRTSSPIRSRDRCVNTASPVHQLTCPLITALPGSPGRGPSLYQATSRESFGVARFRFESRPRASIAASPEMAGMPGRAAVGSVTGWE